jgi:WD40 repeat protein
MRTAIATTDENNGILTESSTQILGSLHMDYIHHIAFDIYGRRMATCSGDRFVRIWDLLDEEWELSAEFQAHRGAVSQLSWCHPEFGTLIATCGSDADVKIWEERTSANKTVWAVKAHLTDARRFVSSVEFAPRHLGLQLATGSADGLCRVYEAVDIQNLSQWPLHGSLQTSYSEPGVTCLSWCTGRFEPPTLVLGGSTHLSVWRYHSSSRQWSSILQFPKHPGTVLDVAWAPNVGRRFHLIASTENGGPLRVYKLKRSIEEDDDKLELLETQVLPSESQSWRCQWNVTGTVLATSGDGGVVQLWKSDVVEGTWKCVSQVYGQDEVMQG